MGLKGIGALWQKTSKAGNSYMRGTFREITIFVFENTEEEGGGFRVVKKDRGSGDFVGDVGILTRIGEGLLGFNGTISGVSITVNPNTDKANDKQPDYFIENQSNAQSVETPAAALTEDDIPF